MLILTGALLVVLSWSVLTCCFILLGIIPARLSGVTQWSQEATRRALWFGVLITTIFVYLMNLNAGLHSAQALAVFVILVAIIGAAGLTFVKPRFSRESKVAHPLQWVLMGTLLLAVAYLAVAALGPVTNYDSGLYHLGAIHYASEFPTVPGLANLYFAFGYSNAAFPLAAFLGNGPWGEDGFRLLNGLFVVLAIVDLLLRLRQRKLTAGTYVLLVGLVIALIPLIALSDYWVTSPSQDSTVMIVTIVAVAYLTDAVAGRKNWVSNGVVALALSIMLILLRPTMVTFGLTLLAVLVAVWSRRRHESNSAGVKRAGVLIAALAIVAGFAAVLRDYVLSGWLQYPLSVHAFSVPWLAADPTPARLATLGYHRDPSDLWNAAIGWQWIGSWVGRLPNQWETFEFALLVFVSLVMLFAAQKFAKQPMRWRSLVVVLAPSVIAVVTWFVASPPSFRFVWGPLFMVPGSVIGWVIWRIMEGRDSAQPTRASWLSARAIIVAASAPILLVIAFSAIARLNVDSMRVEHQWHLGISIPYVSAEIRVAPTKPRELSSGLTVQIPTESDQCWNTYPLCTPDPAGGLALRGTDVKDGFLP